MYFPFIPCSHFLLSFGWIEYFCNSLFITFVYLLVVAPCFVVLVLYIFNLWLPSSSNVKPFVCSIKTYKSLVPYSFLKTIEAVSKNHWRAQLIYFLFLGYYFFCWLTYSVWHIISYILFIFVVIFDTG